MKVFLVRHAKTAVKEEPKVRRQTPESPLGKEGIKQAKLLGKRMLKENIDTILTSKWDRARQTAEQVAKKLGKDFEMFDGIHEKVQHPDLPGVEFTSEIHLKHVNELEKFGSDLDWKFQGQGESLREVINRAIIFKNHLITKHQDQNVLVVTHGIFLQCFVTVALLGEDYDDDCFNKIFRGLVFKNTGITMMEYITENNRWQLRYLNDHMHLR